MDEKKKPEIITLERVLITSFVVDISDVMINVVVAIFSGSVTMLSQALQGTADLLSSGLLLIGMKRSKQPADRKHPYGYGREMYFWTFISGLTTFSITAALSFYWGLQRFLHPEPIEYIPFAFAALAVAILTNGYAFTLSYKRLLGKKSFSRLRKTFLHSARIETKLSFIQDLMGMVASILGLLALLFYSLTGDLRFDGVGAMAVGLTLAFFAVLILKGAKELLVGQSAMPETEETIKALTKSFPEVTSVLDLRTVIIGPDTLIVNIEVHLSDELTTDSIENLIDRIEQKIKDEVPQAKHIQIELETPDAT